MTGDRPPPAKLPGCKLLARHTRPAPMLRGKSACEGSAPPHVVRCSNAVRRTVCFLDVSSLNLAVPLGTATFPFGEGPSLNLALPGRRFLQGATPGPAVEASTAAHRPASVLKRSPTDIRHNG